MIKAPLRIGVSLGFLGFFAYLIRGEIPKIALTLKEAHGGYILLGFLIIFVGTLAVAKRLQLVFGVHEERLPSRETLSLTFVGFFFNNFLPTAIGGDIVKAYCASRVIREKLNAVTCIFMDRFFGLLVFILIPSVTVLFLMRRFDPAIPAVVFTLLVIVVLSTAFIFSRRASRPFRFLLKRFEKYRLMGKLRKIYEDLHVFRSHKRVIAMVCLLSFMWQLVTITAIYLFIRGIGGEIALIYLFLLMPIVHLMSMIPSLNGLGVREMGFLYFFQDSIGPERATAVAILYLSVLILLGLVGGLVYLVRQDYHFRFREIAQEEKAYEGA